jgi:hypothetical protein
VEKKLKCIHESVDISAPYPTGTGARNRNLKIEKLLRTHN